MSSLSLSAVLQIVDEASKPLKLIKQFSDGGADSIDDLTKSIDRLNRKLGVADADRFNKSLKETEKNSHAARSATQMLKHEYHQIDSALSAVIHKADQWNAKLAESRAGMRQEFKSLTMGLVGFGFAASIPLKAFADAEEASTQLKISMLDSTGNVASEFKAINDLANRLGNELPGTTADFQLMMSTLIDQGISFKSILGGTGEAAGKLAVILKMPFVEAATFTAKLQDATQTAEKDMLNLMDTIQRAKNLGVDPNNMLGGFSKLGAGMRIIKQMGVEGTKAMTPLLVMADQSGMTDLSSAGNAYSKVFKAMMNQEKIDKALKGTNIKLNFTDGKGEFGGLDNMFKELEKLKGLSTQARQPILSKIFGNDAENNQVLNLLIDKNQKGYDEIVEKMKRQADLQKKIDELLKTLKARWDQAKGVITSSIVTIIKAIEPDLKAFVDRITLIATKIGKWAEANPKLVRTLAQIAMKLILLKFAFLGIKYGTNLFLGAIISIIAGITKMTVVLWIIKKVAGQFGIGLPSRLGLISRLIQLLSRTFLIFGRVSLPIVLRGILAMSAALLSNPITWIIGLIAGLAFMIYKYWGPIKAFFKGFWDGLKIGLAPLFDTISTLFNEMVKILTPLKPIWDALVLVWNMCKDALSGLFSPFQATNEQLANAVSYGSTVGQVIGIIIGLVGELIMFFVQLAITIMTKVGKAIGIAIGWMVMLSERVAAAMSSIKTWVMEAGAAFINFLLTPIRSIIDAVNVLISALNKIPMVNIPHIPQIPQLTASNAGTVPVKAAQTVPIAPLKIPQQKTVTNHFAAPVLSFSGLQNQQELSQIVEQQMNAWQKSISNSMSRSYSDSDD